MPAVASTVLVMMSGDGTVSLAERLLMLLLPQLLLASAGSLALEDASRFLCKACRCDDGRLVSMLLDSNPGLAPAADNDGLQPVHIAAQHGCMHALHALLEATPACAAALTEDSAQTPLHVAAEHGQREAALLQVQAAPGVLQLADARGGTPLEAAAYRGNVDMLELLLGAAPAAARSHERALLCAAVRSEQRGAAEWLLRRLSGARAVPAVRAALVDAVRGRYRARSSVVPTVQLLLEAQPAAATAAAVADGYAVLHHAALAGACKGAVDLLARAAPQAMEAKANRRSTPRSLALGGDGLGTGRWDAEASMPAALCLTRHGSAEAVLRQPLAAYPPNDPEVRRRADGGVQLCSTRTPPALTAHGGRLYTAVVQQRLPLSADQWDSLPRSIAGLGAALPAALRASDEQASQLACHLAHDDRRRLHAALAGLTACSGGWASTCRATCWRSCWRCEEPAVQPCTASLSAPSIPSHHPCRPLAQPHVLLLPCSA